MNGVSGSLVSELFARVGARLDVDRLYISEVDLAEEVFWSIHEYLKPGEKPFVASDGKRIHFHEYPEMTTTVFRRGEVYDALSKAIPSKRVLIVPVISLRQPVVVGMIGVTSHATRNWGPEELNVLEMMGEVILSGSFTAPPNSSSLDMATMLEDSEIDSIAEKVTVLFERELLWPSGEMDRWADVGRQLFVEHVALWVRHGEPINFLLPSFPCKSCNQQRKVLGVLPDLAEQLALQRLEDFCGQVDQLYDKGSIMLVVSDGRVFADLVNVSDETVARYSEHLHAMVQRLGMRHIRFYALDDSLARCSDPDEVRAKLMRSYGSDAEAVARRLKQDPDFLAVYCGFRKFMQQDLEEQFAAQQLSTNQRDKEVSRIAKAMMARNEAYSNFCADLFPRHIRLSIHAHTNIRKFGVRMLPGEPHSRTPWHSVALRKADGSVVLVSKAYAEKQGAQLDKDAQCYVEQPAK